MIEEAIAQRAGAVLAALGHPVRIDIVRLLRENELGVGQIAKSLDLPQPNISQHLGVLQRVGAVVMRPQGTSRLYRLRGPRVVQMVDLAIEFCDIHGLRGDASDAE